MKKRTFTIYALRDPHTDVIRYIGQTTRPKGRKQEHMNARTHGRCRSWERSLLEDGSHPRWEILDIVESSQEADELERYWIAYGINRGWPLTNMTYGGESSFKHTPSTRKLLSALYKEDGNPMYGRSHTLEARRKIGVASANRERDKEWCEKIGSALKERWQDPEYRETIINSHVKEYPAFYNRETGEIIPPGKNLAKVCKERNLEADNMYAVKNGKRPSHKNWILLSRKAELVN